MNYYLAQLLAGFLVGSLPWGLWMGWIVKKKDIRTLGSGNLGATNVFRQVGWFAGLIVLLLDAGKGYLATTIIPTLLPGSENYPYLRLVGGLAAVTGHVLTPFASFRGGKGVATSLGVFLGLAPLATALSFGVWMVFVAISGIVSLGSVVAALVLPLAVYLTRATVRNHWEAVLVLALLLTLIIWIRHRANLKRLMNGTEASLWKKGGGR
jgi:acyl phosphate:glycerol-3-phosphate acyltransferase